MKERTGKEGDSCRRRSLAFDQFQGEVVERTKQTRARRMREVHGERARRRGG